TRKNKAKNNQVLFHDHKRFIIVFSTFLFCSKPSISNGYDEQSKKREVKVNQQVSKDDRARYIPAFFCCKDLSICYIFFSFCFSRLFVTFLCRKTTFCCH